MERFCRWVVFQLLERLQHGVLVLLEGGKRFTFGASTGEHPPTAVLRVHDARFYSSVAFGGECGVANAYQKGYWSCDDLASLFRLVQQNPSMRWSLSRGLSKGAASLERLRLRLHSNSRRGSRQNIQAHYDLGNDFFASFLDESMMYSCAFFEHARMTLYEASIAKLERICAKLRLGPSDHVLEIGTGWGGFALHAATRYGCRVTTTTISRKQYQFVVEKVRAAGLQGRITVLQKDYRDLDGCYDKLVSIEMVEAVGHANLDLYFRACGRLLKPCGALLLQAIICADRLHAHYRRSPGFLQRYIFPGCEIPSVAAMSASVARTTDLLPVHLEDITPHYVLTLDHWRERFEANLDGIRRLGYSEEFIRTWRYYLFFAAAGFEGRDFADVQILWSRPARCPRLKPAARAASGPPAGPAYPSPP
jgi:cyclopropane-fatty-acyl-phospholipid synthase